jgi:hypothetical protein
MKTIAVGAVVVAAALVAGCANTQYKSFETATTKLHLGRGGTKQVIDGMEFWDNGEPPRHFKIIGFVEDQRPDAPLPMLVQRAEIVTKARAAGGDAVVQVANRSEVVGTSGMTFGNAWGSWRSSSAIGFGVTEQIRRNNAVFAVIRYVEPEAGAAAIAPAPLVPTTPTSTSPLMPSGGPAPQAVAAPPGPPSLYRGGPDRYAAEQYVRNTGCQTSLSVHFVSQVPGIETYSASCINGAALVIQCQYGNCRALR